MGETPRYRLIARLPDGPRSFSVGPDPVVVGRDPHCDVRLEHPSVSRRHCECRFLPDGVALRDLGSANGTYVRDVRIEAARAGVGEPVRFGRVVVRFERETAPAAGEELGELELEVAPDAPAEETAAPSAYALVVEAGEERGERFPLPRRRLVIGRGADADLRLRGLGVSARHAEVLWEADRPVLRDLGSTNGVVVGGRRVESCPLRAGLVLALGKVKLRVEGPAGEEIEVGAVAEDPAAEAAAPAVHTLAPDALPARRRSRGPVLAVAVLAAAAAGCFLWLSWPGGGARKGGALVGAVEPPPSSLLREGFSAEEPDAAAVWAVAGTAGVELSRAAAAAHRGRFGYLLRRSGEGDPRGVAFVAYRRRFRVESGRLYRLEAFARRTAGEVEARLSLRFLGPKDLLVAEALSPPAPAGGWTRLSVAAPAPPGVETLVVGWLLSGGEGAVQGDDLALLAGDLAPAGAGLDAGAFRVVTDGTGCWGLFRERGWVLVRAAAARNEEGRVVEPAPWTDFAGARLTAPEAGELRFAATARPPGGNPRPYGWSLSGRGPLRWTVTGWGGDGRRGVAFTVPGAVLDHGVLVATPERVLTVQRPPLALEDALVLVVGGGRGVRCVPAAPVDVELRPVPGGARLFLWAKGGEEPFRLDLELSLVDVAARARTALDRGREAFRAGRYGDALRELRRVVGPLAVDQGLVDAAQALLDQVEQRFQRDFLALKERAERALFFRSPTELVEVLRAARTLAATYQGTPVAGTVKPLVERLGAAVQAETAARVKALAERYLGAARDLRDRGEVKLAAAYYREVMHLCAGTPWAETARRELEAMEKVVAEVGASRGGG